MTIINENSEHVVKKDKLQFVYDSDMLIDDDVNIEIPLIITGNQIIKGYLTSAHDQVVIGDQTVFEYSMNKGSETIYGNQHIAGVQQVEGYQTIKGNQHIEGNQTISVGQKVMGNQIIDGNQFVSDRSFIGGHRDVTGSSSIFGIDVEHYEAYESEIYDIVFMNQFTIIGCLQFTTLGLKDTPDAEVDKMDGNALEWWKLNKELVLQHREKFDRRINHG